MRFLYILLLVFIFGCNPSANSPVQINEADDSSKIIDSLFAVSKTHYRQASDNVPVFDGFLKKAYNLAKSENNYAQVGRIYNELGKRNRGTSRFSKAIWYHQQAISIAEQYNNDKLHANSIHELAVVFRRMNDNAQALRLYTESLEWAEAVNDTFLIHCSLNGIGNVYFNYKNWEKAIGYYQKSLQFLGKKNRNYLGEAINTNTLGEAWLFLGNTDSAMHYLDRSFNINVKIKSKLGQAICYHGIGLVHLANNEYNKAITSINKALETGGTNIDLHYIAMFLGSLGEVYSIQNNFNLAEETLNKAFKISSDIGSRREALEAANYLADMYQRNNNLHLAIKFTKIAVAYKDSINNDLVKQNTEAMNTLYKAERQEREILILKQNAELDTLRLDRQRNTVFGMIVVILVIVLFFVFVIRQRRLSSLVNQIELEQKLFRSQINPHFIFNSVAAMQNFIMNNDKMEAADYLANFSRLMRNILMSSRTESIVLETEIEILEDYLKLQQLRFSQKFDYNIITADNINNEACLIPPMLVQPFVENSIEHGLRDLKSKGEIIISFTKHSNSLIITVDDNGVGILKEKNTDNKHESLATKITLERLKNYQRITKRESTLKVINKADESNHSGVKVIITIPYHEE